MVWTPRRIEKVTTLDNVQSLRQLGPELILGTAALLSFFLGLGSKRTALAPGVALAALATAFILVLRQWNSGIPMDLFEGHLRMDSFTLFFKVVGILAVGLTVLLSVHCREMESVARAEYYSLLLALALALCVLPASVHLVSIYLAFEFISLTSYILTGFLRKNRWSAEAALKYALYGAAASGTMILGFSYLFALTGTLKLPELSAALGSGPIPTLPLMAALGLIVAGMGFKIAAVPFHMWSPDVYEGAPTPITALFSVGPKAAGFAVLVRFVLTAFPVGSEAAGVTDWRALMAVLSVATMTVGNLLAIQQTDLKRLLAYSSIAHAGYMLMGLAAASQEGVTAILFYLVVYLIMNVGAFLVVIVVGNARGDMTLKALEGLGWVPSGSLLAVGFVIFLFALTGLPPTSGFIGKVYLFAAVIHQGYYLLAVLGALNTVLSLVYYARIVKMMFLVQPKEPVEVAISPVQKGSLWALAGLTLALGLYWRPLIEWVGRIRLQ
ncbi:MAG: NADH-quinone oxidoreductase subunit N [Nitrospirae bacterium]|nr:NADH-quinone oxidoreductase subunit N [Nitrospirota bacterium]